MIWLNPRRTTKAESDKANDAAERAHKIEADALHDGAGFADLDQEIAEYQAAAIREGRDPDAIPHPLAERVVLEVAEGIVDQIEESNSSRRRGSCG